MGEFENAQELFDTYERNGQFENLREAIDILDGLIEDEGIDANRAKNFKESIVRKINNQIKDIFTKCNVREFFGDPKDYTDHGKLIDDLSKLLYAALSAEDGNNLLELLDIKKNITSP